MSRVIRKSDNIITISVCGFMKSENYKLIRVLKVVPSSSFVLSFSVKEIGVLYSDVCTVFRHHPLYIRNHILEVKDIINGRPLDTLLWHLLLFLFSLRSPTEITNKDVKKRRPVVKDKIYGGKIQIRVHWKIILILTQKISTEYLVDIKWEIIYVSDLFLKFSRTFHFTFSLNKDIIFD